MITTITLNAAIDQIYHVDRFTAEEVNRVTEAQQDAGGKGLNVAKVLKQLGVEVEAGGFLGGMNGERIRSLVREKGIRDEFIPIAGESRVCLTIMDAETGKGTELLESGPVISDKEWQKMLNWLEKKSKRTKWFALSGSLPQGLPSDAYAQLIDIIQSNGANAILDTSGEALRHGIEAKPFAIKPNEQELANLLGVDSLSLSLMMEEGHRLVKTGIPHVCFTLGGEGALIVNREGCFRVQAPAVPVKNTVGSGDSFIGGLIHEFATSQDCFVAYKRAVACGAVNAAHMEIGYIDAMEVEQMMKEITITEL
ncbi:1-phosphofructokinase [Sporosarcina sp. Te-1]|uniref:1-phosphofructokinase n=1 Tax=Sporosarcina sp. Te-1 TaxID=2818390 RepID=UPI001A9CFDB9|nr:1-phosphofructokinase [Sporosarcina sp. Te-1]QTD40971.1 1-phosphofructokinase [Sporosarcina sp. Te-1]